MAQSTNLVCPMMAHLRQQRFKLMTKLIAIIMAAIAALFATPEETPTIETPVIVVETPEITETIETPEIAETPEWEQEAPAPIDGTDVFFGDL